MRFSESRKRVLQQAVQESVGDESSANDVEAHAVALAMLAQQDAGYLKEATAAFECARDQGEELNWIFVHMAEASILAGALPDAISYASAVQPDFFDNQDLHWRTVEMDDIRAAALLRMGRLREGVEIAMNVCTELAQRGETDDLASPGELVMAALSLVADGASPDAVQAGCTVLRALARSIEIEVWFAPTIVSKLRAALSSCDQNDV